METIWAAYIVIIAAMGIGYDNVEYNTGDVMLNQLVGVSLSEVDCHTASLQVTDIYTKAGNGKVIVKYLCVEIDRAILEIQGMESNKKGIEG